MNWCPHCERDVLADACRGCGFRPERIAGFDAYAPDSATVDTGYDAAHFPRLAVLEARNFWFRARNRLLLHLFGKYAPATGDYLEVGCGTGFVLEAVSHRFPGWNLHGSEILAEGLRFAADRVPRATLFQMDARQVPFRAAFDAIGAFDVLEHIDDDTRVLHQLHRALRPGGVALFAVPQHPWLWSAQDREAHHVRRYARGELERKLRGAGFTPCWSGSYLTLLLPVLAMSRLRPERANKPHDPFAELRLPAWLDATLDAVMRLEGWLIRIGVRFPVGASRVVVARKPMAS